MLCWKKKFWFLRCWDISNGNPNKRQTRSQLLLKLLRDHKTAVILSLKNGKFLENDLTDIIALIFHACTILVSTVVPACASCISTFAFIVSVHTVNFTTFRFWFGWNCINNLQDLLYNKRNMRHVPILFFDLDTNRVGMILQESRTEIGKYFPKNDQFARKRPLLD